VSETGAVRQTVIEQNGELLSLERKNWLVRLRPPSNRTSRQASQTQPKGVAVIGEKFEGRPGAIAKYDHDARHRVCVESTSTERGERINPLSKVDGFASEENPELRNELDHRSWERRKPEQSAEIRASFRYGREMESLAPSVRSRRSRQSPEGCCPAGAIASERGKN
jgi:hypothetical protein